MGAPSGVLVTLPIPLLELPLQPSSGKLMQVSPSSDLPNLLYSSEDNTTDTDSSDDDMLDRTDIRPHGLSQKSVTRFEKDTMGYSDSDTDDGEFDDPPRRKKDFQAGIQREHLGNQQQRR